MPTSGPHGSLRGTAPLVLGVLALTFFLSSVPSPATPSHGLAAGPAPPIPVSPAGVGSTGAPSASVPLAAMTLSIPGDDPTGVSLSWTATTSLSFSSYSILSSSQGAGGPFQSVGTVSQQSTTSYSVGGLAPETEYWWEIAENDVLLGTQYSNVVGLAQPPPADVSASLLTATDLQLNWTNNATYGGTLGFVSYEVFEVVGTAAPSLAATVVNEPTLTATVTGLSPGASYRFFVNTTDCLAGCGSGSPTRAVSESNSVTIGTPLTLSATISASRTVVDVGQRDLFTCTPSGGQSPYTFEWDLGNGTYGSGGQSVGTTFPTAGSITVTCRITDATPSQATSATTVSVALDPELTAAANRTQVEPGQTIAFSCTVSLGVPPYAVDWTFGDGSGSSVNQSSHAYAQAGSFVATCAATDSVGTPVTGAIPVVVDPALAVSILPSSPEAAPGSNLTFAAVPTNGSGVYTQYDWAFGDGSSANQSTPSVSHGFASAGNFTVSVVVGDTLGGAARASTTVHVSVLSVSLGAAVTAVDTGTAVAFSASASGGAGAPFVFTWHFGDGSGLVGASVTHSYSSTGSFTPTLTVTDRLGASRTVTLATISVSAPPPPAPLLSPLVLLLIAILLGALTAGLLESRRRRAAARLFPSVAGRVPSADPARLVRGRRVCRMCGHSNLAIRETCEACGASLRRTQT